jgi:hypothetical protein
MWQIYSVTNAFWNPIVKFHINDPKHSSVTLNWQIQTLRRIHTKICEIHTPAGFTLFKFPAQGPTQAPIQWVPGTLNLGLKLPGREVDHSPQSSAEVKNACNYTSTPAILLHGVVLS